MGILIKQPPFQNVAAGGRAILNNLEMGDRCDMLQLTLGGTFAIAKMDAIRVRLGGTLIVDITGAQLQDLNEYMGRGVTSTIIPIWFANPNAKTLLGYEQGAIETDRGYSSFSIEVDINGTGVTSPTLECHMLKGVPKLDRDQAGLFRAYLTSTEALSVVGKQPVTPPLGGPAALIARVHMFHTGDVTHLEVKKQSQELLSESTVAQVQYLQNELNRATQTNHLVWDPELLNHVSDQVSKTRVMGNGQLGIASMQFNVTTGATDEIAYISELIGSVETF